MNHYAVDLRYRPNHNRPVHVEKHFSVTAPNRDVALLIAGHCIGVLTRMRRPA